MEERGAVVEDAYDRKIRREKYIIERRASERKGRKPHKYTMQEVEGERKW